ncbi:hypothetical protein C6501_00790 [Candidatus Poribacteria bacterium]|nr:MAG: hypothetical protein C6501_00790 [Candidatus Poribacteria bacterium]
MKKFMVVIPILLLLTSVAADAQWRSKTHDVYNALQRTLDITIDGELDDKEGWEGVIDTVKGTNGDPFCGVEFEALGGAVEVFEKHGGGTWDGADDHETCFAIVWDPDAIYIALSVTDDEHQNGGAAWNGDSLQMAFEPTGKRNAGAVIFLYNVALAADLIIHNERTNGAPGLVVEEDFAITRNENEKETYYEIAITPEDLGLEEPFSEGYEFGLGLCVNDGDLGAGQNGQKGWSGWYPHVIVHGKHSEKTGLVKLTDETLAVEAKNKLTTTWGRLKSVQ